MATQQEVIKKFMASLDTTTLTGTAALDEAIQACSTFKSFKELRNAMISDCKKAKSADDFLKTYCGINLDNADTGAITGSDAGGSTTKTNESIVPESGKLKNFKKNSFTVNGLTIKLGGGRKFSDLNDSEKFIWQGLYTWWAKGALDLIAESYGDNFSFTDKSSATVKELEFNFYTSESGHAGAFTGAHYTSNKADSLSMKVDMRFFGSAVNNSDNPNGKSDISSDYLDRLLAHEFTHAVMFANLDYLTETSLPSIIYEGMCELTTGSTDASGMSALASDPALLKRTLMSEAGTNSYAGGFMFLRYLARQAGDLTIINPNSKTTIQTFNGNDSIYSVADSVTISTGAGNDSIHAGGDKITINGGAGNNYVHLYSDAVNASVLTGSGKDSIYSGAQTASINTGTGNDYIFLYNNGEKHTVNAGKGNDSIESGAQTASINAGAGNDYIVLFTPATKHTVKGGAGNDYFMSYSTNGTLYKYANGDGKDTITGFNVADTLSIADVSFSTKASGSDLRVTVGKGSILLKDAKKLSSNIVLSATNSARSSLTVSSTVKNIDASSRTKAIQITGNKLANSIAGGSKNDILSGEAGNDIIYGNAGNDKLFGDSGNDSLWGGKGNDTLYGGSGKDTFIYKPNEGTDRIKDYSFSEGDMLQILKADGEAGGTFKKSGLSGGNLVLTISGGGSVIFEGVNKGDKFNINSKTYTFNGSKLK